MTSLQPEIPMAGRFENFPLTPSVAREIIKDLFDEQTLWKKNAIDVKVDQVRRLQGGVPGKQPLSSAVKKALQDLQAEGLIANRYGHWQLLETVEAADEVQLSEDAVEEANLPLLDQAVVSEFDLVVEKEIGTGDESVYVFFNPNDRKLALLEGCTTWECKIGKTSGSDSLARVFSLRTALSHQPIVGLVIKSNDCSALEKALHAALRLVDAPVPDSPGVEWFMTSPACVENWFVVFQQSLNALGETNSIATI